MGIYLHDNEEDLIADFFSNPTYEKLARYNSVIKFKPAESRRNFLQENQLYLKMVLALREKQQKEQEQKRAQELAQKSEEQEIQKTIEQGIKDAGEEIAKVIQDNLDKNFIF